MDGSMEVIVERLRDVGLRPTRQRVALARLLLGSGDRHLSAEDLHAEVLASGERVSLATVYNALNQFEEAGLIREVIVEAGRAYFDTNLSEHHHFFDTGLKTLQDIPADAVTIGSVPSAPPGTEIEGIDVVIRIRSKY